LRERGERLIKKIAIFGLLFSLMFAISIVPALAVANLKGAPYRNLNNGTGLYLFEKNANWQIVEGGAWGKLNLKNGVFKGHGLEPNTDYCLINYVDTWHNVGGALLGSGTTNNGGNIVLKADLKGVSGKVWLVLDADVNDFGFMTGWNPREYLFEYSILP